MPEDKVTKTQAATEVLKEVKMVRLAVIGGLVLSLSTLFLAKINFYAGAVFCLVGCSGLGYLFNQAKKKEAYLNSKYFKVKGSEELVV